jgi:hypothetical protein
MPLRAARRFEYLMPQAPKAAPATQVQISLLSAPLIASAIPAIIHTAVPKVIRVTTEFISDLLPELIRKAYKRWL